MRGAYEGQYLGDRRICGQTGIDRFGALRKSALTEEKSAKRSPDRLNRSARDPSASHADGVDADQSGQWASGNGEWDHVGSDDGSGCDHRARADP